MSLKQLVLENRKDDFLRKYREKFTNDELKNIFMLSRDLSSNHKFLMFLGDALQSGNLDIERAKNAVNNFIRYQQALSTKDINQFNSIEDLESEIANHENKTRREVKKLEGADQIYEDDRFVVVTPKTPEASCYYGSGTKWCTASINNSTHFDRYNQDGKLFYILDKKAKSNDRFYKVAMLRKYDGDTTFYDAPDKAFSDGWILGSELFEKIDRVVTDYMSDNFAREIKIFKDKEAAKIEMERIGRTQERQRRIRELLAAERRKEDDEWNIDNNTDESNFANAVFEIIQSNYGAEVGEDESIYNLVPADYSHYNLMTFKWLGEDLSDTEWAVGDWDQVYEAAVDYHKNLFQEMGTEAYNISFVESHLDMEKIEEYFEEIYENDVNDNPEAYFSEDELPLSDEQEEKIKELEQELDMLYEIVNTSEDDEEVANAEERISEIDYEIDEIKESPEGEPSYGQIQKKVEMLIDNVRQNPLNELRSFGFDIDNFIDVDSIAESSVDSDGTGPALAVYDGSENEVKINGTWYYVYRID
jgi:hypothetical protein